VIDNVITSTFQCSLCGDWYGVGPVQVSCTVLHSPGSCCHYGQTKVESPELWTKRNTSTGKFPKASRKGGKFKGVKREN
jgi:hypothetical protein